MSRATHLSDKVIPCLLSYLKTTLAGSAFLDVGTLPNYQLTHQDWLLGPRSAVNSESSSPPAEKTRTFHIVWYDSDVLTLILLFVFFGGFLP